MRTIDRFYQDPLEVIWICTARAFGIEVRRDSAAFAAWDGAGVLRIGTPESLDADDSLAQMVLHELCHALVEGPRAMDRPDWGLEIDNPRHRVREHACLRLQAALADPYGLRQFLAATTAFRRYYDQLEGNPLEPDGDPAVELALPGWQRAHQAPWSGPLHQALRMTAEIAEVIGEFAPPNSLWSTTSKPRISESRRDSATDSPTRFQIRVQPTCRARGRRE